MPRRIKRVVNEQGEHYGYKFHCPGCDDIHVIPTQPHAGGWSFDGNEDLPTFSPSILVHAIVTKDGRKLTPQCHSFVRAGRVEYLNDCTHNLAGQTVDLPEI